ncbi:MAG: SDR family oxidoreductase [Myxococcales bacterium]|nr:SDR family oxidoreductase [Myxococcales bacterium]
MRVLVIGGSGALGAATCRALARRGARLAFTYHRSEARALALAEELGGARVAALDLTQLESIASTLSALVEPLGGLDALIYAAGIASTLEPPAFESIEEVDPAGWDRLMAIGPRGAFFSVRALLGAFGEAGGNIVLLGSAAGIKPLPAPTPWTVASSAMAGMARSLAKELGPRGLRVNVVALGLLERGASELLPESLRDAFLRHSALRRLGHEEEVATFVSAFALSNTYVTGRSIAVDGGL